MVATRVDASTPTIYVLGLRGFPNVLGGVETHAEHLYPLISDLGFDVVCVTRSPYHKLRSWSGVKFCRLWTLRSKYLETVLHSFLAVMVAAFTRPDVVHIHAVGPSLLVPLARFFGLKVVVTHHGPDYDREKWNSFAKRVLRFGEWCGMVFANQRIVISPVIADLVQSQYGKNSTIIPNGVRIPRLDKAADELIDYDVRPGNYVLMVSRFVPEKRHFDLIEAFERAAVPGSKLVLVGDSDHPDEYQRSLIERAAQNSDIVLTGFLKGDILEALYQYAGVFVLPSSHEGLPICLLEALSYGLQCLASDIPANLSVGLDESAYFELGNTDELAGKIASSLQNPQSEAARDKIRDWVSERYDWNRIAQKTAEVYRITGT